MAAQPQRPPVRVRFHFDVDTGDMEFIIDDISPDRSEGYHDKVAKAIAGLLARNPQISDAGRIRYRLDQEWYELTSAYEAREETPDRDVLSE